METTSARAALPVVIASSASRGVCLRLDASDSDRWNAEHGGTVNCQFGAGPSEMFNMNYNNDGTVGFQSVQFPDVYLRVDASSVTRFSPDGGGIVDASRRADLCKFRLIQHGDGSCAIESADFPNRFLRMNGSAVTSFNRYGSGQVSAQYGSGQWERFFISSPENLTSALFGLSGNRYATGASAPACAINGLGLVVEVHVLRESGVAWQVGNAYGPAVSWQQTGPVPESTGRAGALSVAVFDSGLSVVLQEDGDGRSLRYYVARVQKDKTLRCDDAGVDSEIHGEAPSVAVHTSGQAIAVVHTMRRADGAPLVACRMGRWQNLSDNPSHVSKWHDIAWGAIQLLDKGLTPTVALNERYLLVAYEAVSKTNKGSGTLRYMLGRVRGDGVEWTRQAGSKNDTSTLPSISTPVGVEYDTGVFPSISLNKDNRIVEVHQAAGGATLWQRAGRISTTGQSIEWLDPLGVGAISYFYDDGCRPRAACNSDYAVQVHASDKAPPDLWITASMLIDRSNWMGGSLGRLQGRDLTTLVLPATHDAAMYQGQNRWDDQRTQDLSIYAQLRAGVRYFDLRPKRLEDGQIVTYHVDVIGPPLHFVIAQVRRFLQEGHRELIILKLSHYKDFDSSSLGEVAKLVADGLGEYLFTKQAPYFSARLANIPIEILIGERGRVLPVFDESTDHVDPPLSRGLYRYRDWQSQTSNVGDLTVFDLWSHTSDFDVMASGQSQDRDFDESTLPRGQLPKFSGLSDGSYAGFNGTCLRDASIPCDLFLLSWTLTPENNDIWSVSRQANAKLSEYYDRLWNQNSFGKVVNLLYVDFAEFSRATDLAYQLTLYPQNRVPKK